ncbi:YqcI/YcgG family protein [Anoxybacteroides tepidamans]|uniref:YqcI/YcgG family protein n=1 Tax=Anoxybacteroides tepidamans TaxID=265948 RepID=UPI000486E3F0|nr:YqcI/YcgG family protein [Anoxybacillus tepidamans]
MLTQRDEVDRDALPLWQREALEMFEAKMRDKNEPFPCVPATQGFYLNHFRYGFVGNPREASAIEELAALMTEFTKNSRQFGKYTSLIIFFETSSDDFRSLTVEQFEQLFWDVLNRLHQFDESAWPSHIPQDPHHPLWEFCFHGEPYFVFCATPAHAKRKSRSFPYCMLAITPRWVLQQFRASPSAAKVQAEIRKRLERYDSIPAHPHLNSYGHDENYEWLQYFLRDDQTSLSKCPFHAHLRGKQ